MGSERSDERRIERGPDRAPAARIGIVMGSRSDWPTMQAAAEMLDRLRIPYETRVVSAHRTPDQLLAYARDAADRGLQVLIAGAGGSAHLPGMLAAKTWLPVFGVPVSSRALNGVDSLLSIVQMPRGIPVGTLAIGGAGAANAALLAASVLALEDEDVREALVHFRDGQTAAVLADPDPSVEPAIDPAPASEGWPSMRAGEAR